MNNNNFLIGTGYHERDYVRDKAFALLWLDNLKRYCPKAAHLIVLTTGAEFPNSGMGVQQLRLENLGHIGELLNAAEGEPDATTPVRLAPRFCGWSASVLALCLIAYNNRSDLVYLEQDCLAFGPWLETAYADLGGAEPDATSRCDMVFGRKHESEPWQACSQSLFIIRHRFLLDFVRRYLALPPDKELTPEQKFEALENDEPDRFARLSFGVDRERPIPWDAPVFYAQRWTDDELEQARARNLL
jgi:hypothetical protein